MANITRAVEKDFMYDNEPVRVRARRLQKEDVIEISPLIRHDTGKLEFTEALKFWEVVGPTLTRRIESISGLTIDGDAVKVADLCTEFTLFALAMDIINWLLEQSSVGAAHVKKSEAS